MVDSIQCDIAIIGGGAGGLSVAAVAAQLQLKTVIVESDKMGGDCLNYGCVPSKSLISAARAAHTFLTSSALGIEATAPNINFKAVMQHVANVISTIAEHDSVARFEKLGATVIQAHGQFRGHNTLQAGNTLIKAKHFIIATGSSPATPPIPGLDQVAYLTNETIFNLEECPKHLIVIGAGPIGCELAQAMTFLGADVTLLEAFSMMPKDEPDMVDVIRQDIIKQGIDLHEGINVLDVKQDDAAFNITIEKNGEQRIISGTHLLIAAGRKPNILDLNLDAANVHHTPKGINVDQRLRTSNKRIYAIGDAVGPYQFTHVANYHAGIIIKNIIFKLPAKVDYSAIPWVTYTTPELAHVGISASDAPSDANVIDVSFKDNDRAQAEGKTAGRIKVIVTKKGKILGCTILHEQAGDLLLPWIMLIKQGRTLRDLTDVTIPYPTLSEINKKVASAFYSPSLFSNGVRRIVKFLNYFG